MAEYTQGKVYLQDVRSGAIYCYEHHLAHDSNFKPIVPNPVPKFGLTSDRTIGNQDVPLK